MAYNYTVAIAILTNNSAIYLPTVLEAVESLRYEKKHIRLIFVDNYSQDKTLELVNRFASEKADQYSSIKVISSRTTIPQARNLCLEQAEGLDFVFFLDSDTLPDQDALWKLMKLFEKNDYLGIASVPYDSVNSEAKLGFLVNAFNTPQSAVYAQKVAMGCTLISMQVVEHVGKFNEKLKVYEDGEYCFRVRKGGYKIICDFTTTAHHLKRLKLNFASRLSSILELSMFYLQLVRDGSLIYFSRYLLSSILVASFIFLIVIPDVSLLMFFSTALILSIMVNSSNRLWGDGSTIKLYYKPLAGFIFTLSTIVILFFSIWVILREILGGSTRYTTASRQSRKRLLAALK